MNICKPKPQNRNCYTDIEWDILFLYAVYRELSGNYHAAIFH